jgi:hypothetical protein
MTGGEKQRLIRRIAARNRLDPRGTAILWSQHAVAELLNDDLERHQVESALEQCEVIEEYPAVNRPLPDCLVLGATSQGTVIHAVVAIDEPNDRIFVVTVYVPSSKRWQDDWRTRK